MTGIQAIKEIRREQLARLLDQYGKTRLAALVDVPADYLWQMGKGSGRSRRGVSDATARKIEDRLGFSPGSMDVGDPSPALPPQSDLARSLLAQATPRSRSALERILRAAEAGQLSEADMELLGTIARRFQQD